MKGRGANCGVLSWLVFLLCANLLFLVGDVRGDVVPVEGKARRVSTQSSSFGSLPMETLYAEVEFDEDFEHSEDVFCSTQNYKKFDTYQKATCNPCNYSGDATRDGLCEDTNINFDLGRGLPDCECDRSFCQGERLYAGDAPITYKIRKRDIRLAFRYEHSDFESGFLVRLIPIDEGPLNMFVSNDYTLNSENTVGEIFETEAVLDYVRVCPSFDRFGEGSHSITYFIFVVVPENLGSAYSAFELSVELITNLTPEEEGDYKTLDFWPGAAFANSEFSNSPTYLTGNSLAESNGGEAPRYFQMGILIPLTECVTYSFSIELLTMNTTEFNYFSLIGAYVEVGTLEMLEFLAIPRPFPERVFAFEEVLELGYKNSAFSSISEGGTVFTSCPTGAATPDNPEYIVARISSSPLFTDWQVLVFLRKLERDTRTRKIVKLADFSPLHYQRNFGGIPLLRCPCEDPCDSCEEEREIRFFNRLSGLQAETYTALIDESNPGCDLAPELGNKIGDNFFYRCLSPWRDTACGILHSIPVYDYGNPRIYPLPLPARLENPFSFSANPDFLVRNDDNNNIKGNVLGSLIVISAGELEYLKKDRLLEECSLGFAVSSVLHTSNDAPPEQKFYPLKDFKNPDIPCTQSNFNNVGSLLNQAQQELSNLARTGVLVGENVKFNVSLSADELIEESGAATFASYSLLFTQEWQSCQELSESFLEFEEVDITLVDSTVCTVFDGSDPCCNATLAWETCCDGEGRDVVLENVREPLSPNEAEIEDECVDSECIETFVEDFRVSYQEVVIDGVCRNEFLINTGLNRVVSQCRRDWLGEDEFGKLCYTNTDCTEVYGTGQCDTVVNRCTGVRKEMELGFLDCLISDVDSVTRSSVTNELARVGYFADERVGKKVTAELLRAYLVTDKECASDYGPMSEYRSRFVARSLNTPESQLCPVCYDIYCLSPFGCDWPIQCLDKRKNCQPELAPFTTPLCQEPTGENIVCDWDNSLSEADCNLGTPVCMYCHNSSNCEVLPATNQDECENTPICLLPGGEIRWDVSEEDCDALKFCTETCFGEKCTSQETCEEISGFCEDEDAILESVEAAARVFPNLLDATKGVCVTPISADNAPSCPYLSEIALTDFFTLDSRTGNSFDFTTHRGCINFTHCIPDAISFGAGNGAAVLPTSCDHQLVNPEECDDFGGIWLDLPIQSEQQCQNPLEVDDDKFPGYCLEDRTGERPYLSRKDRDDCEECGGVPRPPAVWRKGRWIGGISTNAEWRNPKMTGKFHYVSDSISFITLNDLLALSSANVDSFLSEVGVSCSIFPFSNYYSLFSCGCGGADSVDECPPPFQTNVVGGGGGGVIGGAWFCPDVSSKVGVSVGTISINGSDVTGDLCKFAQIALANVEVFVGNRERVPTTVLGDPNPVDDEAVRNNKGASVGEVVGNGIQFVIGRSDFVDFRLEVTRVELSLFLDVQTLKNVQNKDHVFDFGIEMTDKNDKRYENEVELRPLGATLVDNGKIKQGITVIELLNSLTDEEFSVELTGYWDKPFEDGTPRLYPITRQEDYEDENPDDVLSHGEKIMVGFFGALYGLAFLISLLFTLQIFSRVPSLTNLILCFLIYLVFIFRCVYLSMFAAGHFREEDASSFVLVEPPSFFIISIASVILMSFGFCLYCLKTHLPQDQLFTRFWMIWLVFNLIIYLILVVVLVLETQLDTSDTEIIDCFGRVVEIDENFTIQAIRIGYHSFLLVISLVTCVSLFFLGKKLEQTADSSSLSNLSLIAASSVFLTSLLWVVYSGASGSSPYFVIPLFFCEVVPLLALMIKIVPPKVE